MEKRVWRVFVRHRPARPALMLVSLKLILDGKKATCNDEAWKRQGGEAECKQSTNLGQVIRPKAVLFSTNKARDLSSALAGGARQDILVHLRRWYLASKLKNGESGDSDVRISQALGAVDEGSQNEGKDKVDDGLAKGLKEVLPDILRRGSEVRRAGVKEIHIAAPIQAGHRREPQSSEIGLRWHCDVGKDSWAQRLHETRRVESGVIPQIGWFNVQCRCPRTQ
ncbi:hypothetical protein FB451DRAFT_1188850 [Mycena latifolia]|nr:hypothetical protein FB451DRAFT_1188850 [Mycena latifolia]